MERRDLLRSGAIVTAVAIAGCSGGDDEGNGNGDAADDEGNGNGDAAGEDEETTDENETDLDDETGDENETDADDETTEDGDGEGDDTNGNESDDAGGEDATDETEDNESASNETEGDGEDAGDGALFSDVLEFEESYAFETTGAEGVASSGRFHGGNTYMSIEESGGTVEMYTVEGETYIVEGEQCMVLPGMAEEEFDEEGVEDPEAEAEAQSDLRASDRDEIDGEEVYVFEISGEEAEEHDEDVTYYVSVETGYVRRIEAGGSVTDFHSWGDVDPIEPPEMECRDLGDINESDIPF